MRLLEVRSVLRAVLDKLDVTAKGMGGDNVKVSEFRQALEATAHVRDCGVFATLCDQVLNLDVFRLAAEDSIVVTSAIHQALKQPLAQLRARSQTLLDVLEDVLDEQDPLSISVRLPDSSNLSDVTEDLNSLEKLLNQILVDDRIGGSIRLITFDRGTNWIELALGSELARTLILGLTRCYYEHLERRVKAKTHEALFQDVLSQVNLRKQAMEAIANADLEAHRAAMDGLLQEIGIPDDAEYRGRLELSYERLTKLLDRGVQIHPALLEDTPPAEVLMPISKRLIQMVKALPPGQQEPTEPEDDNDDADAASDGGDAG